VTATSETRPGEAQPNFGFVIDNRQCIGCHACSTACKSENEVPLGVYRTWVKSTETGLFPDTQRHFQVTRCNHCENPPCVSICPTAAMYQRSDGIVEFNKDMCIGCKGCMQACPYDAIYIDPETQTAAKCHFCSHRIEVGLEPACVVVCPEHAILAGDMNDPSSEISQVLAANESSVRKPSLGTSPKLFYIEGNEVNLHPTATERWPQTFSTTDVIEPEPSQQREAGLIHIGGSRAEHMAQVGYNAQHQLPWHWPVPAYLVTKGIASGLMLLLAMAWLYGNLPFDRGIAIAGGLVSLIAMGLTTALLVYDLEQPQRFLYILRYPQWSSWLVRGAVFLIGFSNTVLVWWLIEVAAHMNWLSSSFAASARTPLLSLIALFGVGTAIYTAFLFAQAKGRELWKSKLLPLHMLIQAIMVGAASLLVIALFLAIPEALLDFIRGAFGIAITLDLILTMTELGVPHGSDVTVAASRAISRGRYARMFWGGSLVLGHLVPLALLATGLPLAAAIAALCAVLGLYLYEYAFVMAPQEVPNS
jgi:Fe-S-cluster-containing dehydrogenase component/formate-dependent nitrite reductase membrane component NrfD